MKKEVDPVLSKHMSEIAKMRKNPYLHFKDPEQARLAGANGKETQRKLHEAEKTSESKNIPSN